MNEHMLLEMVVWLQLRWFSGLGDRTCWEVRGGRGNRSSGEGISELAFLIYGAFHSHGGTPIAGWFIYKGQSNSNMDDDWGCPYFRKHPCVKMLESWEGLQSWILRSVGTLNCCRMFDIPNHGQTSLQAAGCPTCAPRPCGQWSVAGSFSDTSVGCRSKSCL